MSDVDALLEILIHNFDCMEDDYFFDTGSGSSRRTPLKFEVLPREYLDFAEEDIDKDTKSSRINCVSNLKRALDCQVDIFLHAWGMLNYVKKRRMGTESKLKLLASMGLLNERSVTRLNKVRNKAEHEFAVPEIEDLGVYYDLVAALIVILEQAAAADNQIDCELYDGKLFTRYSMAEAQVTFTYHELLDYDEDTRLETYGEGVEFRASLSQDQASFVQMFGIMNLLSRYSLSVVSRTTVLSHLRKIQKRPPASLSEA